MATPRGAQHFDLEQRLRDLERQVQRLTSMSLRRSQLGVTSGDFAVTGGGSVLVEDGGSVDVDGGDVNVTGGGSVTVQGDGTFELRDASGDVVWSALDGPLKTKQVFQEDNSMNLATSFTSYGSRTVNVPNGYTKAAVLLMVSAGSTFSVSVGNVAVQPVVAGTSGPSISSGNSSASVATSFFSTDVTLGPGDTTIELHLKAKQSGGADSGSGNWHMSGMVLFTR